MWSDDDQFFLLFPALPTIEANRFLLNVVFSDVILLETEERGHLKVSSVRSPSDEIDFSCGATPLFLQTVRCNYEVNFTGPSMAQECRLLVDEDVPIIRSHEIF